MTPISRLGNCGICVFWEKIADRSDVGYQDEGLCRRRAPSPVPVTGLRDDGADVAGDYGLLVAWPRTFGESDWCGEYQSQGEVRGRHKAGEDV